MVDPEILHQMVLFQRGCFQRIRRWLRGTHPDKGTIIHGWTGWETVQEKDRILPLHSFSVGTEQG